MSGPRVPIRPRPHQLEAIGAAERAFTGGADRVQWRMACGSGKTLAAMWLAERIKARTVVVFAPSIALVAQTLQVWNQSGIAVRTLAVCSDASTAAGLEEIGVDGINPWSSHEIDGVVTMRPDVVARFLDGSVTAPAEVISVVVSTYHSCEVIGQALSVTDLIDGVDFLIADEAHHLVSAPAYSAVLEDHRIRARRRLFQTATPVADSRYIASRWDCASGAEAGRSGMRDEKLFGPTVFSLTVGAAIGKNLLADYRVLVTAKASAGVDAGDTAALAALREAVRRYGVRRILSFHNRVAGAHEFARQVNDLGAIDGVTVRAAAVDGTMSAERRRQSLDRLAGPDAAVTVISSAQCLREGIDIPAVDAVLFANPRASSVGIVQAVGRALRLHPTKTLGHIIIPVVLEEDGDDHEQLAASSYAHVWRVLRGLAAHDDRVAHDLIRFRGIGTGGVEQASWLDVGGDADGLVVGRLLRQDSPAWDLRFALISELVERLGSAAHITAAAGKDASNWVALQRLLYRRGDLDDSRAARLEALAGWWWDPRDAADERALAAVDAVIAQQGSLRENRSGASIYRGFSDGRGRPLRVWVGTQLVKYRSGELAGWLRDELAGRPGWTWTPLPPADEAGFEALRSFLAWEGHCDIPADAVEGDVRLGEWIAQVRRRKVTGELSPALEAMILAAAPPDPSGRPVFRWNRREAYWALNMEAAARYIARTGTLLGMPGDHKEIVDDHPVALWQWLSRCRHERNTKGTLPDHQAAALERLHGFTWKLDVPVAARVDPASPNACTVPDCDRRRSRRGLCNVHYQAQADQLKAAGQWVSAYVDADPARRHVHALKAAGVGERRISDLSGVSRTAITKMLNGSASRGSGPSRKIATSVSTRLLAIPLPDTANHAAIADKALVAAAGTVARLQALVAAGHPRSQLAARLGITAANATRLFDPGTQRVTAATARRAAALFDELKDTPGPSPRARNDGRRLGWAQPAELNIAALDAPNAGAA